MEKPRKQKNSPHSNIAASPNAPNAGIIRIIPLLLIIFAVGILAFLLIASLSPFTKGIFSKLFNRPSSQAEDALQDVTNQLLQKLNAFKYSKPASPNNRLAAAWSNNPTLTVDLNLTDGQAHKIRFYSLDWDNSGRTQKIDILGASTGTLLDSKSIATFNGGKYLTWNLSGHVIIRFTATTGASTVLSGIFFDPLAPASTPTPSSSCPLGPLGDTDCNGDIDIQDYNNVFTDFGKSGSGILGDVDKNGIVDIQDYNLVFSNFGKTQSTATAQFIGEDSSTQGSWEGVYGTEGYSLTADAQVLPSYAQLTVPTTTPLTWSATTSDVRALQKPTDRTQLITDLIQIAQTRKNQLETEALANPKHAALYTLSPEIVHGFVQPIQPYLEQQTTVNGKLNIIGTDLSTQTGFATMYKLNGYNLSFAQFVPSVTNASQISVKGSVIGQSLLLSQQTDNQLQVIQPAPQRTTTGSHTIAVILFNFKDNTSQNGTNGDPITIQNINPTIFEPNLPSVYSYYKENSFNQLSFDILKSRFFDWKTINIDSSSCDSDRWATMANPPGVDLTQFDHIIYVFPNVKNCAGSAPNDTIPKAAGWADIGGNRIFINGSPTIEVIGHEIGHNLGLAHGHLWNCGKVAIDNSITKNPCIEMAPPSGDAFDLMGNGEILNAQVATVYPHFNGPHKIAVGWIPPQNIQTIKQSGIYHLAPEELTPGAIPLVLKINKYTPPAFTLGIPQLASYRTEDYYLDYRGKFGQDTNIDPQGLMKFHDGVQIHMWDGIASNPTLLIRFPEINQGGTIPVSLPQGEKFIDTLAGITITGQQVTTNDAALDIQIAPRDCVEKAPLITVDPVFSATFGGQAITYPIHITNTDNDQCTKTDFNLDVTAPSVGWSFAFSKALVTLLPGESADLNLTITSPSDLADGVYTLSVSALDLANSQHTNSQDLTYVLISGSAIACYLSNPIWSSSQTTKGTQVTLTVTATDPCIGQMANFQIRRSGSTPIDDTNANIQPAQIKITGQTVKTTWIAEFNPFIPGTNPNYYFLANIVGQTKTVKSGMLLVTDTAPFPSPSPEPTLTPSPTPTPQPTFIWIVPPVVSVTANGTWSGAGPVSDLFDCNLATGWNSASFTGIITAHFTQPITFSGFRVTGNSLPNTTETYTLLGSNDGLNWTQFHQFFPNFTTTHQTFSTNFNQVTYSYLRIQVNGNGSWVSGEEIRLLATSGSPNICISAPTP